MTKMMILMMSLLGISIIGFWMNKQDMEEINVLIIILSIILGIMLAMVAPWPIQLGILLLGLYFGRFYNYSELAKSLVSK
jgi:predicted membrane protein